MNLKQWWQRQVSLFMQGPQPERSAAPIDANRDYRHLKYNEWCEVIQEFTDHDGGVHPEGETWVFLGHNFVPCEDGMSFFVSPDGDQTVHIRLQWRPEEQGEVLEHLERYVVRRGQQ